MAKKIAVEQVSQNQEPEVHPLQKNYRFVSKRNVDYNNLTAFEAVSLSVVAVLAITVGVIQSTLIV